MLEIIGHIVGIWFQGALLSLIGALFLIRLADTLKIANTEKYNGSSD